MVSKENVLFVHIEQKQLQTLSLTDFVFSGINKIVFNGINKIKSTSISYKFLKRKLEFVTM